mgnify:CR=1 FL=1
MKRRRRRGERFSDESVDPMNYVSNLSDAMLVLAVTSIHSHLEHEVFDDGDWIIERLVQDSMTDFICSPLLI